MLRLEEVQFAYQAGREFCFTLDIPRGSRVAVTGKSGVGKTTLLMLIAGFELPQVGAVYLDNRRHTTTLPYERPISLMLQDYNLFPHLTISQNLGLGINPTLRLAAEEKEAVEKMAALLDVEGLLYRLPATLSGGERQRVALGRALLRKKPILLLDEPFCSIDRITKAKLLAFLVEFCQKQAITLLLVSHQPEDYERLTNSRLDLLAGGGFTWTA